MSTSANKHADCEELHYLLTRLNLAPLNSILKSYNQVHGINLRAAGKKAEQLSKLISALYLADVYPDESRYYHLRHYIFGNTPENLMLRSPNFALWKSAQTYNSTPAIYSSTPGVSGGPAIRKPAYVGVETGAALPGGYGSYASASGSGYRPPAGLPPAGMINGRWQGGGGVGGSALQPVPRPSYGYGSTSGPSARGPPAFKASPFWSIKEFVGKPITLVENYGSEKKTMMLGVTLTAPQVAMLQASSSDPSAPRIEVRLFCTKQQAYDNSTYNGGKLTATVEFPLGCEIKVNSNLLPINLKGTKKTPAKVSPPNLNKDGKFNVMNGVVNKVELIYTGASSRYAVHAALCTITSPEILATRIRTTRFKTKEEVSAGKRKALADDDIVAGSSTLNLRCPLTYMRMTAPCRSSQCNHTQCFDAGSFFQLNEQSPTWICPICNSVLAPEQIILDGYVDDILSKVPDTQDSVVVEPDGSWHSSDGKYTSTGVPLASKQVASVAIDDSDDEDQKVKPSNSGSKGKGKEAVQFIDDTPSPPAKPRSGATSSAPKRDANGVNKSYRPPVASTGVIDLTLDSDSDEDQPIRPSAKRPRVASSSANVRSQDPSGSSAAVAAAAANRVFTASSAVSTPRSEGLPNGNGSISVGTGTDASPAAAVASDGHGSNGSDAAANVSTGSAARGSPAVGAGGQGSGSGNENENENGAENGNGSGEVDGTGAAGLEDEPSQIITLNDGLEVDCTTPSLQGYTRTELFENDGELARVLLGKF